MSESTRFRRDETGSLVEKVALYSALLGLGCILGADLLSSMLQKGELPAVAFVRPEKRRAAPTSAGVDMSATASIPVGRHVVAPVSPCDMGRN
jgi:hypothetical protein